VKLSDLTIKDSSGEGGSRTIKMGAKGAEPEAVAFHARRGSVLEGCGDAITKDAAMTFYQHGLGAKQIGNGYNWYIEEWGGNVVGDDPFCCKRF